MTENSKQERSIMARPEKEKELSRSDYIRQQLLKGKVIMTYDFRVDNPFSVFYSVIIRTLLFKQFYMDNRSNTSSI